MVVAGKEEEKDEKVVVEEEVVLMVLMSLGYVIQAFLVKITGYRLTEVPTDADGHTLI